MLALCFFLGSLSSIAAQVSLGGECWSSANGVASGGCASGTQCGPWLPDGGSWDGTTPWYCLANPKLASGATCDYATKNGLCATGLSCCNGACASSCDSTTTVSTTTAAAALASTTTTVMASTTGTNAAGQVTLGGECWSSANGVASGGCAPGTQCGPWLPSGGAWDGTSAWYCLATPKLASGASCDYSDSVKMGLCDTGMTCCNNVCAASCDSTTAAGDSTTTTASSSTSAGDSTTTVTSTTTTTTATSTTTVSCLLGGMEVCGDNTFPEIYASQCCQSPLTCEAVPGSTRTSMCNGANLAAGATCWESDSSNGTCASGTLCKTAQLATTGTCTTWSQSSTCVDTGVYPYNICYYSETQTAVKNRQCCPDFNTGLTSYCLAPSDNPTGDMFCMPYGLDAGAKCGMDAASGYAGVCASPNGCVNGVCGTTTSTTTTQACIASGSPCWDAANGPVGSAFCCPRSDGTAQTCPVSPGSSANCP